MDMSRSSPDRHQFVMHSSGVESIPEPAQRNEMARPLGRRFDLLAQVRYLVVDDSIGDVRIGAPDRVEQLIAGQHVTGALDECRQQLELERGKFDDAAVAAQFGTCAIELRVAEAEDLTLRRPLP